jgi:uncharacterized protein involved in exopolysaccharide biosynthesis
MMKHARKKLALPATTPSGVPAGIPVDTEGSHDDYHLRVRSPSDLFWVARRHAGKTFGTFFAAAGLAVFAFLFLPVAYRSDAKVLMRMGRESLSGDMTVSETPTVIHTRKSEMNTELEILKSRDLHLDLISAIGAEVLVGEPKETEEQLHKAALKKIANKLRVVSEIDSNVITVSYTHPDRETAQRILQVAMQLYLDKHVEAFGTNGAVAFFQQEANDLDARIAELRTQLRRRMDTLGVTSLEAHKLSLIEVRSKVLLDIQTNRTQLDSSRARAELLKQAIDAQEKIVFSSESLGTPNALAEWLKLHISELKLKKKQLEAVHHPKHELVLETQDQIDLAEEMLKGQAEDRPVLERAINTTRQQLELEAILENANLASLTAQNKVLQGQQEKLEEEFTLLQMQEGPILSLKAELATLETRRGEYLAKIERARLHERADQAKLSNINVLQAATLPTEPAGPPRIWILLIGVVLAGFCAMGVMLASDYYDTSFLQPGDVRRMLDTNVLASFPRSRVLRMPASAPPDAQLLASVPPLVARELELLAGAAVSLGVEAPVIAVTSARPGAGVSTVAFHLAVRLAAMGTRRTLLVDAVRGGKGLTETLDLDADQTVQRTAVPGLDVVARPANEADAEDLFATIERCRVPGAAVVIDLSALSNSATALEYATRADCTVFVVDSKATDVSSARRSLANLVGSGARILGAVLNGRVGSAA